MAQQTAIDWFINQINQYTELQINHADGSKTKTRVIPPWIMKNLIEQAKQLEKEQHQETFKHSRQAKIFEDNKPPVWKSFDEYYNETYNKE